MISADEWRQHLVAMGVRPATAEAWQVAFANEVQPERFSAGIEDLRSWLPQILHEFALLERLEENLSYTPERMCKVWPGRFPTLASAIPYAHSPRKLANLVYGGRMGNVDPDDGWNFRGRPMLTGRATYQRVGDRIGQDLVGNPDLLLQPHYALAAAICWWEGDIPDAILSDQAKVRRRVQGGALGLEHCLALYQRCLEVFP